MSTTPSTSDLFVEHGDVLDICELPLRQFGGLLRFEGTITTFKTYEDNLILKRALQEPGAGRVMVVDTEGSTRCAMLGDNMAKQAVDAGWAGIIVHGAVRDVAALRELPIGIRALQPNPRRSRKEGAGDRDVAVAFGGAIFRPGDHVVSDDDGLVVLRRSYVNEKSLA